MSIYIFVIMNDAIYNLIAADKKHQTILKGE